MLVTGHPSASAHPGDEPGTAVGAVSALPAPRATVTDELSLVRVTFGTPVADLTGHVLQVTGPDGDRVDVGQVVRADARTLGVGLRELGEQGPYEVRFTALLQGHRAEGGYRFLHAGPIDADGRRPTADGRRRQAAAAGAGLLALAVAGVVLRRRAGPASPVRA